MIEVGDNCFGAQTMGDCAKVLQDLKNCSVFTYDSETSGLDWKVNHTVGHVIKPMKGPSYYVPLRHTGGGNVPGCSIPTSDTGWDGTLHPFEIELAKVLAEKERRVIGQNLAFDLRFSSRVGLKFYGPHEDTMINAPLIDENMRSFSLESLAVYNEVTLKETGIYEYLAEQFGGQPTKGQMANWWKTDASDPRIVEYATGDGITTEEVWEVQQRDISEQDLGRVHDVECRVIRTLHRVTSRGINIDEEELVRCQDSFKAEGDKMKESLPDWFKNIRAPTQLKRYFEDQIDENWPRHDVTPTAARKADKAGVEAKGSLKFDEDTIIKYKGGPELIEIKKMDHAISSFTTPMLERHLWNGRVHCEFNQMKGDDFGTTTGRLSSSNPNLQQIPKRNKKISKPYRRAFLPEAGHLWWDNDYAQQEYVVFTNYSRDPNLMAGYRATPPVDIHTTVANMLGVERDPSAKRMNLGMLYGMGVASLALALGVSEQQARIWMNDYHRKFPFAKKFLKQAEARARERGFVFTYLGRRRRFPDPRFAHKAGNAVIQGSSADITKLKMVEVDDYFESEGDLFNVMLQCHDSLSWSGPEDRPDINDEAVRIMRSFGPDDLIKLDIPIAVDSDRGINWSEATFGA